MGPILLQGMVFRRLVALGNRLVFSHGSRLLDRWITMAPDEKKKSDAD